MLKTHPQPLPGGEQNSARPRAVPFLGKVRGGFVLHIYSGNRSEPRFRLRINASGDSETCGSDFKPAPYGWRIRNVYSGEMALSFCGGSPTALYLKSNL